MRPMTFECTFNYRHANGGNLGCKTTWQPFQTTTERDYFFQGKDPLSVTPKER